MGQMNSQGYHIERVNNTIYINSVSSLGCLYGVYGLLEELFNYEQISNDCYLLDTKTTVAVPTINKTVSPDVELRLPSNGALLYDTTTAKRMGVGLGEDSWLLKAGDYTNNNGAGWKAWHNSLEVLPPDYWKAQGKTNWFSDDGTQLCYTAHGNPDDYSAMVAQIVNVMGIALSSSQVYNNPNVSFVTLTTEDGDGHCTCNACKSAKATYGSDVGAVIALCNDVRAGMEEWMDANPTFKREITLLFFAYNAYLDAPAEYNSATGKYQFKGGLTMRPDVGVMYAVSDYVNYYFDIMHENNADFRQQFEAWSDLTKASGSKLGLWTYSKNFGAYMLRADVYGGTAFFNNSAYRYFAEKGVDLWFNQGATNGTTTLSAFEKLNGYIDSQMMRDSTQDVELLTEKWFNAMYGEASTVMRTLYNAQNTMARNVFGTTKEGIPTVSLSESAVKQKLTKKTLDTWFGYINEAKAAVAAYATSNPALYAKYIERINEEWIAVEYLYVSLYYSKTLDFLDGVTVDVAKEKAAFREVLGYDEATGTYAKDVLPNERAACTIAQWVESDFTKTI